jgi:hypothetical protein
MLRGSSVFADTPRNSSQDTMNFRYDASALILIIILQNFKMNVPLSSSGLEMMAPWLPISR